MSEQQTARAQQSGEGAGVAVDLASPDVLDHPDTRDRVEGLLGDLAVVAHADLDAIAEARGRNSLAGELRWGARKCYPGDAHPVVGGGVDRKAAPATADVEHALPRF